MINEAIESVKRMQEFNADSLSRKEDLGNQFQLEECVEPAKKLIRLYKQISIEIFEDLPDNLLSTIQKAADSDFNKFQQALDFEPATDQTPSEKRNSIISTIKSAYDSSFPKLYPFISYSVSKATDFKRLEDEARATLQSIHDESENIKDTLSEYENDAKQVLAEVRKAAAEQGVSQQAIYFNEESEEHGTQAETWKNITYGFAIVLGIYAVLTVFLHKWEFLSPNDLSEGIQLVVSKFLIFFVLVYMLSLSAKNFLNHKHNQIVNKHRQNALMTFQALTEAASTPETKDVVLNHAASCIFKPQDTGYIKDNSKGEKENKSIIQYMPRNVLRSEESTQ